MKVLQDPGGGQRSSRCAASKGSRRVSVTPPPRVYSQAQIAAQYATGELEVLDEEHPEQIGHRLRTQHPPSIYSQ